LNFHIGTSFAKFDALVVLVDGNRQALLGFVLSDYILIKKTLDLTGLGHRWAGGNGFCLLIVGNDLIADVNAFITDVDGGTGNQFLNFILRLTTERTAQRVVGSSNHRCRGSP
jgi:hypothetical protein